MRFVALALAVVTLLSVAVARAAPAVADGGYRPPVDAPVTDPFRPPATPYGAGNRGLDYGTRPGTAVGAAADGEVVFAGQVGGTLHVVVLHGDGIRTSYSYLSAVRVLRGDTVRQGQVIGTTGAQPFHFGARAGDAYVDPALLFATGPPEVHLVPEGERRPGSEAHERSGLLGMLRGLAGTTAQAAGAAAGAAAAGVEWAAGGTAEAVGGTAEAARWAAGRAADLGLTALRREAVGNLDELRALVARCFAMAPPVRAYRLAAFIRGALDGGECTPSAVQPPPVRGHIAVLVGGLGSSGAVVDGRERGGAAIFAVDTAALGYAPHEVVHFSYRGGTTADHPYDKGDTEVDLRTSGARLRALLERIQYEHPGVPVDVLAHSQGGLVTRAALAPGWDRFDPRLPRLGAIVTMGSPHHGTDAASALALVRRNPASGALLAGVHRALPSADNPRAVSIAQMSEGSGFIARLNDTPLPTGVHVTSVAARQDWLVPAAHTHLAGARNVTVDVPSATAHDALPSSVAGRRETALALNGMPPTCHSLLTTVADTVVSEAIRRAEHSAPHLVSNMGAAP
ncbi:MAG: peptidase [Acidimicrobiales bacterium]|nr:peptidase [Acidimicrobiales bacterium]